MYKEDLVDIQWSFKTLQRLYYLNEVQLHDHTLVEGFLEDVEDFLHQSLEMLRHLNLVMNSDQVKVRGRILYMLS